MPPDRYGDHESRASPFTGPDFEGSPVVRYNPVTDAEPDSGAVAFGGVKRVENVAHDVFRNPGSGGTHGNSNEFPF